MTSYVNLKEASVEAKFFDRKMESAKVWPKVVDVKESLESQDDILLKSLLKFYSKNKEYLKMISKISSQKTNISLRELDYTVTNYGRDKPIIYSVKDNSTGVITEKNFNLYLDYKRQLKGFNKRLFDPFCRRQRVFLRYDLSESPIFLNEDQIDDYKESTEGLVTTIGQLNFFKWAFNKNVIRYCFENKSQIKKEMERTEDQKLVSKNSNSGKKRQLSKNNKTVHKEVTRVVIQFS